MSLYCLCIIFNSNIIVFHVLTLLGAGGTGGLVLVRGGVKNTPPQNLKISGSEAQHV